MKQLPPQTIIICRDLATIIKAEKAAQNYYDVVVKFGAFGGLSWKPVVLQGTWIGLKIVFNVYQLLLPRMKHREFTQLTKQSGKCLY